MNIALLAASLVLQPDADTRSSVSCDYDKAKMMALSRREFDQDLGGGWRIVAEKPRCRGAGAGLIRDYRTLHPSDSWLLYWHEGQLRAGIGQTRQAIELFEQSRRPAPEDRIGWNHYVDASIAFLNKDRPSLLAARRKLAAFPKPADFEPRDSKGQPIAVPWPPNLNVVDGFIACFGKSYDEAYSSCSKSFVVVR